MITEKRKKEIHHMIEEVMCEVFWIQAHLDSLKPKVKAITDALKKDIEPSSS